MAKLLRFFALLALAHAQPKRLTVDEINAGDRELLGPADDPCSVCVATETCEPQDGYKLILRFSTNALNSISDS